MGSVLDMVFPFTEYFSTKEEALKAVEMYNDLYVRDIECMLLEHPPIGVYRKHEQWELRWKPPGPPKKKPVKQHTWRRKIK